MFKFTLEEKIKLTAKYAADAIQKYGRDKNEAIESSQSLHHLSNKRMKDVRKLVEENIK